ncbi:MAG: murein biosynthesis integral membrane protein MurJ [Candidatus Gastranaerophilales bacterium]|nr:murein biosynthesis integral membrane protein MurJ [Candidatus Gastranaerophilales bacterium]
MNSEGQGLFRAAGWIAFIILLSKIVGFLRDVVVANYYGASIISDAYFYAYQIPALVLVILGGVGGPFHSATVAVFSKLIKDFEIKPKPAIKKLFNTFETFSIILFTILALICFFFPETVMRLIISGENTELLEYASKLLKVMSPIILVGAVIGLYYGILVTYKKFLLPNISPSMLSLGVIIVLLITKGDKTGFYLALGTLFGALLQFLLQVHAVRKIGYGFKPAFNFFKNKSFKEILELLFPAFLSSTIGQLGIYVDMFFSSALKDGAWTAFSYANRIFQFPAGLMLTAILVPLFPLFSRLVAKKDTEGVRHYYKKGIGTLIYAGTFLMVCIFVIRTDAIRLALERGAFDAAATVLVSNILFFITLSILPYVVRDSATRLFYSYGDSKIPFVIAIGCILLKLVLNMLLVRPMGIEGIALSTSLVTLFNAAMLTYLLRKKISIGYKDLTKNCIKILFIGALTFLTGEFVSALYSHFVAWNFITGIIKLSLTGVIMLGAYCLFSVLLKIEYMQELIQKIKNRDANV